MHNQIPPQDRLIELVRLWSRWIYWDATWDLITKQAQAIDHDRKAQLAKTWIERDQELDDIRDLVERYYPHLLGSVPERQYDPPFDESSARKRAAEMRTLLGLLLAKTSTGNKPSQRRGRRTRTEKSVDDQVLSALCRWHQIEDDGSVGNDQPASDRKLANLGKPKLTNNALTRFLATRGGFRAYHANCRDRKIGLFLKLWRGEVAKKVLELLPSDQRGD